MAAKEPCASEPAPEVIGQAVDGRTKQSVSSTMAKGGPRRASQVSSEEAQPRRIEEVFVTSPIFEIGSGVVILLSVLSMTWEIDEVLSPPLLQFLESAVTSFFLWEWLIRLKAHGWRWLLEPAVVFDTFLVWGPGVLAVWILQPAVQDSTADFLKVVRTIRMLRLLRLVFLFKHFKAFQDLFKLVRGLLSSGSTLLSAMGLIAATLYTFAIFAIDLIGNQDFTGAGADVLEAQKQFQGIFPTMVTLMRFMHGDDCQGIIDVLTKRQPWIWVFLWVFTSLSSYVLLNLVTAVIVQQALEMSSNDEAELALQLRRQREEDMRELEAMFMALDEDQSGQVSLEEFMQAFKIKEVKTQMTLLGLKEGEMIDLFRLLDTDGEGELSLDEFMQGMSQLKGLARNKDMLLLEKSVERLGVKLQKLEGRTASELASMGAFDQETGHKLRETFQKIKDNIDERLTQAEREVQEVAGVLGRLWEECAALPRDAAVLLQAKAAKAQTQALVHRRLSGANAASANARGSLTSAESAFQPPGANAASRRGSLTSAESAFQPQGAKASANARGSLSSAESAFQPRGANAASANARGSLSSAESAFQPRGANAASRRGSLTSAESAFQPRGAATTSARRRGSASSDTSAAQPRGARTSSSKREGGLSSDASSPQQVEGAGAAAPKARVRLVSDTSAAPSEGASTSRTRGRLLSDESAAETEGTKAASAKGRGRLLSDDSGGVPEGAETAVAEPKFLFSSDEEPEPLAPPEGSPTAAPPRRSLISEESLW